MVGEDVQLAQGGLGPGPRQVCLHIRNRQCVCPHLSPCLSDILRFQKRGQSDLTGRLLYTLQAAPKVANPFDWHAPGRDSAVAKLIAELEAKTRLARSASASGSKPTNALIASPHAADVSADNAPLTEDVSHFVNDTSVFQSKPPFPAPAALSETEIARDTLPVSEQHHSPSDAFPLVGSLPSQKQHTSTPPAKEAAIKPPASRKTIGKAGCEMGEMPLDADEEMRAVSQSDKREAAAEPTSALISRPSPYVSFAHTGSCVFETDHALARRRAEEE